MEIVQKVLKIVPPLEFIEQFLEKNPVELIICRQFYEIIQRFLEKNILDEEAVNDVYTMVDAIKDHLWEIINTGHFSKVNTMHRQLLTLVSLQKAVLLLMKGYLNVFNYNDALEKCMWELDNGLLLGCPFSHTAYNNILNDCLNLLQTAKKNKSPDTSEKTTLDTKHDSRPSNESCDIDVLVRPSIQHFNENYFNINRPAILKDCMTQWPALEKWNHSNYLLEVCRNRVVPIEIGKNYTNETWSQDLVKFEDFFRRQFLGQETPGSTSSKQIEYLAQHNLFDQIPALRNDIFIPEYCCTTNDTKDNENDVDIKAWLGPEGTTSPMHIDEKHNLLCQVFGSKRIILAAPEETQNLYVFDGDMLKNTSQIDAEHLDYDRFPLLKNVKFYTFTLYKGEMLYIPPKWWHYVRSLAKSFSVSYWWK